MISLLFVLIASFFNSCMDTFENTPNFNESIFKNFDKKFWCKDVSWQYAKRIGGYKFDAWHLSKSAMIFCIIGAIILFRPILNCYWWVYFIGYGIVWNATFITVYHILFKVK